MQGTKGKGKGKGYQGECFNFGQIGHKAFECRARMRQANEVEAEEFEEAASKQRVIGGVWTIANVGVEKCPVKTNNAFAWSMNYDEDDEKDEHREMTTEEPLAWKNGFGIGSHSKT